MCRFPVLAPTGRFSEQMCSGSRGREFGGLHFDHGLPGCAKGGQKYIFIYCVTLQTLVQKLLTVVYLRAGALAEKKMKLSLSPRRKDFK